jgi:hypothetical protein
MIRDRKTGRLFYEDEWRRWLKENNGPSFDALTPEILELLDADPVFEGPYPLLSRYQTARKNGAILDNDGKWYMSYAVTDLSDEEKVIVDNNKAESVRIDRNKKLSDTDWVVIKAVETNSSLPSDWIAYRQALRDISQQSGFPWDVEWPIEPK